MPWTHGLIGTDLQTETGEPREEPVPLPQKMWNSNAKKEIVSPAADKVTSLGIARINQWIANQLTKGRKIPKSA